MIYYVCKEKEKGNSSNRKETNMRMNSDKKETLNVHVGGLFSTLLAIAFIVLKLCNVITWSWLWVLSPLWIPLALTILIILIAVLIAWIADRF